MFLTSCAFDHSTFIFAIRNGFSRFLKSEGGSFVKFDFTFASAEYLFNPSPNPIRKSNNITTNETLYIFPSLMQLATVWYQNRGYTWLAMRLRMFVRYVN